MATILIVDDVQVIRDLFAAILASVGHRVVTARSGAEAFAALKAEKPGVVLLDIELPDMTGLQLLAAIRADPDHRDIAVIIVTTVTTRSVVINAVKLSISDYLPKELLSPTALISSVERAITARSIKASAASLPAPESAGIPPPAPTATVVQAAPFVVKSAPPAKPRTATKVVPAAGPAARVPGAASVEHTPPADIKSLKPILARGELLDRLKASEELKGLSPTVSMVLSLTASGASSLEDISRAIAQDQAMALKVLRVANSPAYTRGDRVDTVHKAVLRIGMSSIRQTVLNIGVVERFSSPAFDELLDTKQFWEHSIACAIIASQLGREMGAADVDSVFTAGLLHDLGRVILAEALGAEYVEVLRTARAMHAPLEQVESRMLLMSHADVMDRLLSAWQFPKQLVEPIMHHHLSVANARGVSPSRAPEILRLGLADRLAHAMLLGDSGNETIYPTEAHCRALGIGERTLSELEDTAVRLTDDTKVALLASSHTNVWPRSVERVTAMLAVPLRPLYVSADPGLDAYRIFVGRLAGGGGEDGRPNVAILHLAERKTRDELSMRLQATERETGVDSLPLIVLTPPGGGSLGGGVGAPGSDVVTEAVRVGRRIVVLPTPTPVGLFVVTLNELLLAGAPKPR